MTEYDPDLVREAERIAKRFENENPDLARSPVTTTQIIQNATEMHTSAGVPFDQALDAAVESARAVLGAPRPVNANVYDVDVEVARLNAAQEAWKRGKP